MIYAAILEIAANSNIFYSNFIFFSDMTMYSARNCVNMGISDFYIINALKDEGEICEEVIYEKENIIWSGG